jgi:hypothetical protein
MARGHFSNGVVYNFVFYIKMNYYHNLKINLDGGSEALPLKSTIY